MAASEIEIPIASVTKEAFADALRDVLWHRLKDAGVRQKHRELVLQAIHEASLCTWEACLHAHGLAKPGEIPAPKEVKP